MSGFSDSWLALREPADHAARSVRLSESIGQHLAARRHLSTRSVTRVLDLATGTGSNPRYLAPYLSSPQEWIVLDTDVALLKAFPIRMAAWASRSGRACVHRRDGIVVTADGYDMHVRPRHADVSQFPIPAFMEAPALVTASALLDLVSGEWLVKLASACVEVDAAVLFALNYDGRIAISPAHESDERIADLVNRHQHSAKGFGPALGPDASDRADVLFSNAGYRVQRDRSDWVLGPAERKLQEELIVGWAAAAAEVLPTELSRIERWKGDRLEAAGTIGLTITVGHEDLGAWPVGSSNAPLA